MHCYVPKYVQVDHAGTTTIALITAQSPFGDVAPDAPEVLKKIYAQFSAATKTKPTATRVLGVYTGRAGAEAAYDAWCDEVEGTVLEDKDPDPWDGLTLQILPCEVQNVPALFQAAQTGDKVYVSRSSEHAPEKVLTGAHFRALVRAANAACTHQVTDLTTGRTRGLTAQESENLNRRLLSALLRGSEEVPQALLAVLRAGTAAATVPATGV